VTRGGRFFEIGGRGTSSFSRRVQSWERKRTQHVSDDWKKGTVKRRKREAKLT